MLFWNIADLLYLVKKIIKLLAVNNLNYTYSQRIYYYFLTKRILNEKMLLYSEKRNFMYFINIHCEYKGTAVSWLGNIIIFSQFNFAELVAFILHVIIFKTHCVKLQKHFFPHVEEKIMKRMLNFIATHYSGNILHFSPEIFRRIKNQ